MRVKAILGAVAAACLIVFVATPVSGAVAPACIQGSAPAGQGGVEIRLPSVSAWCSAQTIRNNPDVTGQMSYQVCTLNGVCRRTTIDVGISVAHLLAIAFPHRTVQLAEVIPPVGVPSVLQGPDLTGSSAGNGPIFGIGGGVTRYVGPAGVSGSYLEEVSSTDGSAIILRGYASALSNVSIAGSPLQPLPDHQVQFFASPTLPGAKYRWSFSDGRTVTDRSTISHSFSGPGRYDVYVTVEARNGAAGVSPVPASVNVQKLVKGRNYKPPAKHKNNPSTTGSGNGNGGTGTGSGSNNTNTTPTNSSTTSPSAGTTTGQTTHAPPIRTNPRPVHAGTIVSGRLISAVTPISPAQLASGNFPTTTPVNQRITPAAVVGSGPVRPIAGIAAAVAIVLLLGSGAGQELRSLRRSIASARLG